MNTPQQSATIIALAIAAAPCRDIDGLVKLILPHVAELCRQRDEAVMCNKASFDSHMAACKEAV